MTNLSLPVDRNRSEADIKKAIMVYLKMRGHIALLFRNVGIRKKDGGFIPVLRKGISDIIGLTSEGKFFAIEVKKPGNKLTQEQQQFLDEVKSSNGISFVAYSVQDIINKGL